MHGWRSMVTPRLWAAIVILVLASCTSSDARASTKLPAPPNIVTVSLKGLRFHYRPPVTAGRVVFRLVNDSQTTHSPVLVPLDDDVPPIDTQLHGPDRIVLQPIATVVPIRPGARATFAVDLEPGRRYAFICQAVDNGQRHALEGMNTEFRTAGAPSR